MSTRVVIRFNYDGTHYWPDAPKHLIHMRDRHQHVFNIEVAVALTEDDLEAEFRDLMDRAMIKLHRLTDGQSEFGAQSVEMIAQRLAASLVHEYQRPFTVSVFEDGMFGAVVTLE